MMVVSEKGREGTFEQLFRYSVESHNRQEVSEAN